MNDRTQSCLSLTAYVVSAGGALLIVAALAGYLAYKTRPAPINQARIEERLKNLREINAAAADALNNYGWQDQTKGLVRLPITNAMDRVVQEWKNPAAGRSNLLARVEKANPPKAPEKPNQFE